MNASSEACRKLALALSAESERLTEAKLALAEILALKPDFTAPETYYFAVREIVHRILP